MIRLCVALLLSSIALAAPAGSGEPYRMKGTAIYLWPHGAPGSEGKTAPERWISTAPPGQKPDPYHRVTDINNPSITPFLAPEGKANGAAFIIAPGGGHRYLVVDLEGDMVAKKLNEMGVAGFVLKSRLAKAEGSSYRADVESLADVQRAIRLVRSRAKEWGLDPGRIGVMGFSAGGQLAALAENRFDAGNPEASDPVDRLSSRPDFVVLAYPGLASQNIPIAKEVPPTFMFVNNDDNLSAGSAQYYLSLKKAGVDTELHVFRRGGHGVGATGRDPVEFRKLSVSRWPDLLQAWMADLGFLRR
ncbi:MAG TPA: alpha/beta hydrolase [Bryobacteraceae bacterium]|nr:alpha/beta hydrolase [Bryobacteraceae bacterium]